MARRKKSTGKRRTIGGRVVENESLKPIPESYLRE